MKSVKPKAPPGKAPAAAPKPKGKEPTSSGSSTATVARPVAEPSQLHKRSVMEQEFDRLRALDKLDEGVDAIGPKGLQVLCQDLGIAFNDFDMFVLVFRLGATQSYCITRPEWMHAVYSWKIEHIGTLKNILTTWRSDVKSDEGVYTEMYYHLYDFIRGDDEKLLPLDKAVKAWKEYKRNITRDVWRQLWEFARKIRDLSAYDPNDKWPTALDDFVEWAKAEQAKKQAPKKS